MAESTGNNERHEEIGETILVAFILCGISGFIVGVILTSLVWWII
jgi:hypothetical protein